MNEDVMRDLFNLVCGRELGAGMSRRVYEAPTHEGYVIKVESETGHFQNVKEWNVWQRVRETSIAKWFAPCHWISPYGTILIQQRTSPVGKYPERIPSFFTDTKRANFGFIDGHLTCHDYGVNLLMEKGMALRLKKAEWWDLDDD